MSSEEIPESQSRQREWEAFRSLALTAVRVGFRPESIHGQANERLLQIVRLPSFDAVTGWEVFRVTDQDAKGSSRYIAAGVRWDQKRDVDMFYHPIERLTVLRLKYLRRLSPALTFTTRSLTEEAAHGVESMIALLLSSPVPLLLSRKHLGLDGTSYELGMGDHWAGVRFHWWEQAPPEWNILQETVGSLLNTLESSVDEGA